MPEAFASRPAPRLIFGPGSLRELPGAVRNVGGTAVFVVSDPGIARAGHLDTALRLLGEAGLPAAAFADSRENPTESDAAACRDAARAHRVDCIVAIGGGSTLDTAKACNFLLTNGGVMHDYHGYGKAARPLLPLIAIPTTAGTGSETQSYALISRDGSHEKMACGDPKALPAVAILDPDLTATLPHGAALLSGVDALTHAIESAVCTKANALSRLHAEGAFRHLATAIDRVVDGRPTDDDRAHMLLGAALAGTAIENSMLGAAHACANPLTARLGVVHGRAVATMLPQVMRFNAVVPAAAETYAHFGALLRLLQVSDLPLQPWLEALVRRCRFPALDPATDFALLADDATRQWTGKFNPRPLQREDFISLYRRASGIET
ncbi:MAG: iron-containing alcohol dehydrogenase [Opitutaceae bacterium]